MTVQPLKLSPPPPATSLAATSPAVEERSPAEAQKYENLKLVGLPVFGGLTALTGGVAALSHLDANKQMKLRMKQGFDRDYVKNYDLKFRDHKRDIKIFGAAGLVFAGLGAYSWWNSGGDKQFKNLFGMK
jgi:hypothetical protein